MLEVALALEQAIKEYFNEWTESDYYGDRLTDDEWEILRYIKSFLEVLKQSTKALESPTAGLD